MNQPADPLLPACDSLYVGTTPDDVARSCAARLLEDARARRRVVVLAVFGEGGGASVPALESRDAHVTTLRLPDARARHAFYSTWHALALERHPEDDRLLDALAERLADIAHTCRAREVHLPLGVGGHVDGRLANEAALRAFRSGDGRNVFLYEERPEAMVRGAVRVRLGHLGARLPPGAARAAEDTRLPALMMRAHVAPAARGVVAGWGGRLQAATVAARQWRASRSWHPQRGFGPRLQPVVVVPPPEALEEVRDLARVAGPGAVSRFAARVDALARGYARRLAGADHAERYWLLLPDREERGTVTEALDDVPA